MRKILRSVLIVALAALGVTSTSCAATPPGGVTKDRLGNLRRDDLVVVDVTIPALDTNAVRGIVSDYVGSRPVQSNDVAGIVGPLISEVGAAASAAQATADAAVSAAASAADSAATADRKAVNAHDLAVQAADAAASAGDTAVAADRKAVSAGDLANVASATATAAQGAANQALAAVAEVQINAGQAASAAASASVKATDAQATAEQAAAVAASAQSAATTAGAKATTADEKATAAQAAADQAAAAAATADAKATDAQSAAGQAAMSVTAAQAAAATASEAATLAQSEAATAASKAAVAVSTATAAHEAATAVDGKATEAVAAATSAQESAAQAAAAATSAAAAASSIDGKATSALEAATAASEQVGAVQAAVEDLASRVDKIPDVTADAVSRSELVSGLLKWVVTPASELATPVVPDMIAGIPNRWSLFQADSTDRSAESALTTVYKNGSSTITDLAWPASETKFGVAVSAHRTMVPVMDDIDGINSTISSRWDEVTAAVGSLTDYATNNYRFADLANGRAKKLEAWHYTNEVGRADFVRGMTDWAVMPMWPFVHTVVDVLPSADDDAQLWALFRYDEPEHSAETSLVTPIAGTPDEFGDITYLRWTNVQWEVAALWTNELDSVGAAWVPKAGSTNVVVTSDITARRIRVPTERGFRSIARIADEAHLAAATAESAAQSATGVAGNALSIAQAAESTAAEAGASARAAADTASAAESSARDAADRAVAAASSASTNARNAADSAAAAQSAADAAETAANTALNKANSALSTAGEASATASSAQSAASSAQTAASAAATEAHSAMERATAAETSAGSAVAAVGSKAGLDDMWYPLNTVALVLTNDVQTAFVADRAVNSISAADAPSVALSVPVWRSGKSRDFYVRVSTSVGVSLSTDVTLRNEISSAVNLHVPAGKTYAWHFVEVSRGSFVVYGVDTVHMSGDEGISGHKSFTGAVTVGSRESESTVGGHSFVNGDGVRATGAYSHGEGLGTTNTAAYAHSEGEATTASGKAAHSEGIGTVASGTYSHAEGEKTVASGKRAHSEGASSVARGNYSHVEGLTTAAMPMYMLYPDWKAGTTYAVSSRVARSEVAYICKTAHTAGSSWNASYWEQIAGQFNASHAHAEGERTIAAGDKSHAEGYFSAAIGQYSYAGGYRAVTAESGNMSYSTSGGFTSSVVNPHRAAFAWQGQSGSSTRDWYHSHGDGTFNINPIGGLAGFYIGDTSLNDILGRYYTRESFDRFISDYTTGVYADNRLVTERDVRLNTRLAGSWKFHSTIPTDAYITSVQYLSGEWVVFYDIYDGGGEYMNYDIVAGNTDLYASSISVVVDSLTGGADITLTATRDTLPGYQLGDNQGDRPIASEAEAESLRADVSSLSNSVSSLSNKVATLDTAVANALLRADVADPVPGIDPAFVARASSTGAALAERPTRAQVEAGWGSGSWTVTRDGANVTAQVPQPSFAAEVDGWSVGGVADDWVYDEYVIAGQDAVRLEWPAEEEIEVGESEFDTIQHRYVATRLFVRGLASKAEKIVFAEASDIAVSNGLSNAKYIVVTPFTTGGVVGEEGTGIAGVCHVVFSKGGPSGVPREAVFKVYSGTADSLYIVAEGYGSSLMIPAGRRAFVKVFEFEPGRCIPTVLYQDNPYE